MGLEKAFSRLALRHQGSCQPCHRAFSTSVRTRQQRQTATTAFADAVRSQGQTTETPASVHNEALAQTAPSSSLPSPAELAQRAVRMAAVNRQQREERRLAEVQMRKRRHDLESHAPRRWKSGDVYAPHDLSPVEASKWKRFQQKPRPKHDVMDQLGINPLHHYKNFSMISEYISEMGRIKHGNETGLRPVNQRRMAKAIRRAMGIGLVPGVHRHPEILKREREFAPLFK